MGDMMKCPYCDSMIKSGLEECPRCHAKMEISSRERPKVHYLEIIVGCFIVIVFLLGLTYLKIGKKSGYVPPGNITTEEAEPKEMSKNLGVYSGLINPVKMGVKTFATLRDDDGKSKEADVQIIRYLTEEEINEIVLENSQTLIEGFRWVGVQYQIILNDFAYLGEKNISPVFKMSLHDYLYKNDFFLVNEHYYNIPVLVKSGYNNIKNNESTEVSIAYQVPIDQQYYLCFGGIDEVQGCYDNL